MARISGNRKIPTLSSCRQGRRESPPVDGVSTPRSGRWASVPSPGGLVAGAPCIRVNEASGAVIRGDPKHRWPARPHSVSGLEPPSLVLLALKASKRHRVSWPWPLQWEAEGEVRLVENVGVPWCHVVPRSTRSPVPALQEKDGLRDACRQSRANASGAHGLAAVVRCVHPDHSQRVEDRVGHLLPRNRL